MNDEVMQHWGAYRRARDFGHKRYVAKAERCEKYFRGDQWDPRVLAQLGDRPALTANMILATMATAFGQMAENYTEVLFYSKDPRNADMNEVLRKVFRHIYNENRLRWKDLSMAMDGLITSRGFLDVRMAFDENLHGDVRITHLDPRDVLIDPDARDYLPTGWKEVFISRWLTLDEIRVLYGEQKAKQVEASVVNGIGPVEDIISDLSVGGAFSGEAGPVPIAPAYYGDSVPKRYRVVERQYRKLDRSLYFVDLDTGESRPVPDQWDEAKVHDVIARAAERGARLTVVPRLAERIRMVVFAGSVVLHDAWSPYETFTIVPYFPYFRWGETIGVVENLLDLQDATNKTLSQTLHVINTTANSGWIVKSGALVNMAIEDLEERGAETGLVLEVTDMGGIDKIAPNQIPTGLDRITQQLSEWVKYVSGISDSMRGFDRADVAAKAIIAKQQAGAISLTVPFESLNLTRRYLAEVILKMVQRYYTEPRIMRVAPDELNGEEAVVEVNMPNVYGQIVNDLTLGEYSVVVKSVPPKERQDEATYQRALSLREAGVPVPDWVLVESAGLPDPGRIMRDIEQARQAQEPMAQLEQELKQLEARKTQAEMVKTLSEAELLRARLQEVLSNVVGSSAKMRLQDKNLRLKYLTELDKLSQNAMLERERLLAQLEKEDLLNVDRGAGTGTGAAAGSGGNAGSGNSGNRDSGGSSPRGGNPGSAGDSGAGRQSGNDTQVSV